MNETQNILQNRWLWPVWIVLLGAVVLSGFAYEKEQEALWGIGVQLLVTALVFTMHLRTRLESNQLVVWFWPIWRRRVALTDIQHVSAITYRPLRDFGGWGIRIGKLGVAYSVSGTNGIRIGTRTGRNIVMGTRRSREWMLAFQAAGVPGDYASVPSMGSSS